MITPRLEGFYDKSLTLKRLHDLGAENSLEGYRQFASIAPSLVIRDMSGSADEEIRDEEEKQKAKMDDIAAGMDYLIKLHLLTASKTINFLDRFGSSTNPQMKELKGLLVKLQGIFIKKHEACKEIGLFTEENTKGKVVDPDVFKVHDADGN
jgi:hypothetical protein